MAEGNSLINLGELSKPATVLIEKISDAVGGIFRPWQMRRVGQAEAEVARVQAATQIEISDLEYRAIRRRLAEEAMKQKNIEDIAQKALPALHEDARPEDIENDWIANFFDKCRLISDEQMQELWARVLAGEANAPDQFSKRTVNLLASFDKADAELFRNLCSFVWSIEGIPVALVFDYRDPIYGSAGINRFSLQHLETIGLISVSTLDYFQLASSDRRLVVATHPDSFLAEFPSEPQFSRNIGEVMLTRAGQQLAPISGAGPAAGFHEHVIGRWKSLGVKIEAPMTA